jgi:transmembrane sensor
MSSAIRDMTNLSVTPPDDAAAFWLVQRDRGAVLESDPRFTSWLAASQNNSRAWERAVALWDKLGAGSDPLTLAMRQDALSARRPSGHRRTWLIAVAAVIVMLAVPVGWNFLSPRLQSAETKQLVSADAAPTFAADATGPSTFALPDGSRVTLNANSALAATYSDGRRAVRLLRGEAFFSVMHDSKRPFTTDAGTSTILDLGTDFDVRIAGDVLSVTLVRGSLAVTTTGNKAKILTPGQRLDAGPGQADRIATVDIERELAWRTEFIEFQDETLGKAIADINRYGGAPARIVDPAIESTRVSGRFRAGDPSRFARALAEIYPFRVTDRADGGVDIGER